MTEEELNELLSDAESGDNQIDWCDVGSVVQPLRDKNPDDTYDKSTAFLNELECVVYKISNGTDTYCGRSTSLFHRIRSHERNKDSKAYHILKSSDKPLNELITIIWKGYGVDESIKQEADAIEKYSTVGQKKEEAIIGKLPDEFAKRIRKNTIPNSRRKIGADKASF